MAATYTISTYQQMGNNKYLLSIFNGSGSGKIAKIYKIWIVNHANVSATGTLIKILTYRTSASSAGSDISSSVTKHLTSDASPPAQITFKSSSTETTTSTFRQVVYCSGTSATSIGVTYTWNQWSSIYGLMRVFECGYYNTNLEPLTLREGEGVAIRSLGASTNGFAEVVVEFTLE